MSHVKTRGFVVREVPVGEHDRIVSILTEESGLITVSVRGARRPRSPHLLTTQAFSFSSFELFFHKGRYSLNASDLIEAYIPLQKDISRLVCAAHLAEVLVDCMRDELAQPVLFRLWAYAMQAICNQPDPLLAVHTAQMRLLMEIGLAPLLDHCLICGQPTVRWQDGQEQVSLPVSFSVRQCGVICDKADCLGRTSDARLMPRGLIACLQHIRQAPLPRLFNFQVAEPVRIALFDLSGRYLSHHMEKPYVRLAMYESLQTPADQPG